MKNPILVVSLLLLLCFVFGCQNKAEKAELENLRAQAMLEGQNKAVVNRMWEAWNKGDFEAFKEVVAPEYVFYTPSRNTKPMSREETIEMGKAIHKGFPDVDFSIEELIAGEDKVVSRYIMRGTHQGEWAGIPPTGKKIEISGIIVHRIENGKVVEDREEWDSLGTMQQLGMELKPKEAEKK